MAIFGFPVLKGRARKKNNQFLQDIYILSWKFDLYKNNTGCKLIVRIFLRQRPQWRFRKDHKWGSLDCFTLEGRTDRLPWNIGNHVTYQKKAGLSNSMVSFKRVIGGDAKGLEGSALWLEIMKKSTTDVKIVHVPAQIRSRHPQYKPQALPL
jgi:hypothetical protein